jgi:RHS repeat-associated protein
VLDSNGQVVEIQEYDPYGKTSFFDGAGNPVGSWSQVGNPFGWKAVRIDPETGLLYMRHRYYSPQWGRFLTQDPLGVWGDPAGLGNSYQYGANTPLVASDPMGLQVLGGGRIILHYNPNSGSYGTSNPREGSGQPQGWRDSKTQERIDTFGQVRDLGGFGNVEVLVDGAWRELTIEEQARFTEILVMLQANVDLHNQMRAMVGMFAGVAFASAAVPLKFGNVANPCKGASSGSSRTGSTSVPQSNSGVAKPVLRTEYEKSVRGLADMAESMRKAGNSAEEIAEAVVTARNALKAKFRAMTPDGARATMEARNINKYQDPIGPNVKWLRDRGKTLEEIIEGATRPGGGDLGF